MPTETSYNCRVVRQFAIMTVVWGVVGMTVGVFIAAQLLWPELNFNVPWLSYGRLRPLHTNAVIFATSSYVVQRTAHARLFSDRLAAFTFWGWQAVIVAAAITLPMGITSAKEYAELEWPIDILIALVWVAYAVVFFGTLFKRKVPISTSRTGSSAASFSPWRAFVTHPAAEIAPVGYCRPYSPSRQVTLRLGRRLCRAGRNRATK